MIGLFKRAAPDSESPGRDALALPARDGQRVPPGCTGLAFDERGNLRRFAAGTRLATDASACIFHPGPYVLHIAPFAQSPEAGLRLTLLVDTPDPRVATQRFELFLAAEVHGCASVDTLCELLQAAVRREIGQGGLLLPPCTSIEEWHAFRRGLDELVYMRFGMIVDDCLPADLGGTVDLASILAARAQAGPEAAPPALPRPRPAHGNDDDARALRRLFLELPGVRSGLRLALPAAGVPFARQRALLARLDRACVAVDTMPALALRAPNDPAAPADLARRALASVAAAGALDEAWALLGRLRAASTAASLDEADRIVANLERALQDRRAAQPETVQP